MGFRPGWEWLIVALVIIVLFGAKRLPDATRSLGRSMRIFKSEVKGMKDDDAASSSSTTTAEVDPPLPAPPAEQPRPSDPEPAPGPSSSETPQQPAPGQSRQP